MRDDSSHCFSARPFSGKEIECSLYGQPVVLLDDQAQWLADIGHRVEMVTPEGKKEIERSLMQGFVSLPQARK